MHHTHLHTLHLEQYRSFEDRVISFDPHLTLILGENGKGKTNILEAVCLISTGRSVRGHTLSDCVRIGSDVAHITVNATIDDESQELGATLVAKENSLGVRTSTRFRIGSIPKRRSDVVGVLKSVIFRPEDLDLIDGSPSKRRSFLDDVLVQVSHTYAHALHEYEKTLKHRNKLIGMLREGMVTRADFYVWDTLLCTHGDVITRERARFLSFLNTAMLFPVKGEAVYDHSFVSEERLHQYAMQEVAAGSTLVGPHRDEVVIRMQLQEGGELMDVSTFGSRGQQRLSVLWLKMAAVHFIEQETKIQPVILLDDVFSELDEHNRSLLFSLFTDHQVLLTSAEELSALPDEVKSGSIIQLD